MELVLTGPSGVGKGSVCKRLLAFDSRMRVAVSCTTRPRKSGEEDGVHYDFVTKDVFQARAQSDYFLEWAEVHGNLYGTPRFEMERIRKAGFDLLLEVDCQGAEAVRKKLPSATTIFLAPPNRTELERRLRGRGRDHEEEIRRRLTNAPMEMASIYSFSAVVVNDNLDRTVQEIGGIIESIRRGEMLSSFVYRNPTMMKQIMHHWPDAKQYSSLASATA